MRKYSVSLYFPHDGYATFQSITLWQCFFIVIIWTKEEILISLFHCTCTSYIELVLNNSKCLIFNILHYQKQYSEFKLHHVSLPCFIFV
jgi:predicted nucleic acid-binding Zn finger protein